MFLVKSSLTVVLLGDWNKQYIQPDWVATNIYCQEKMDLGVFGQGTDFNVNYRCNNIVIQPSQSQMIFNALDMNHNTIERLVLYINNFLQKATTPVLQAYGFNCEFTETKNCRFADVLDTISDNSMIIQNGYEIISTKITRSLTKNGKILILESSQNEDKTIMHFNEHHGNRLIEMPTIEVEMICDFLSAAKDLILALGYDIEEAE